MALCAAMLASRTAHAASFPLGIYIGNPNGSTPSAEATFETAFHSLRPRMQANLQLILTYIDYTQAVSAWPSNASWQAWSNAQSPVARKLAPVIGFPLASIAGGSPSADQQFQQFAAGTYDSEIQAVVQAWTQQGFKSLIFRIGWEMNLQGNTYAGNSAQDESDWKAAFRHIATIIRQAASAAGATASIVWNPGATNYGSVSATGSLYPGDAYVDIIGVDMYADMYPYSDGGSPATYHDWATGAEDTSVAQFIANPVNRAHYWSYPAATEWSLDSSQGHAQSFLSIAHFAGQHGKPFAVPECGAGNSNAGTDVPDDPTFPKWLASQLSQIAAAGTPIAFVDIWNSNGGGNYEFSFATDSKPLERAAWPLSFR